HEYLKNAERSPDVVSMVAVLRLDSNGKCMNWSSARKKYI
ncbi:hypothetical protein L915_16952, partial [Phytophthora nicotianae]